MKQHSRSALSIVLLFAACFFSSSILAESTKDILVVKTSSFRGTSTTYDQTKEYKYQVLQLLLEKTEKTDGPFRIEVPKIEDATYSRNNYLLNEGIIDVFMTITSKNFEEEFLPIRIPFDKGMYGYRIAIINESDQPKFSAIRTLEEFQKLWAGQNEAWPDTKILRANGFNVTGVSGYVELFSMLKDKRFDFFPRGLHEPWKELSDVKIPGLVVEKDLALHYPAPGYIFTSRKNPKLADRLERGFRIALKDGSFDKLFYNHPIMKAALLQADLKNRRIFELKNPLLSDETPLNDKSLWIKP